MSSRPISSGFLLPSDAMPYWTESTPGQKGVKTSCSRLGDIPVSRLRRSHVRLLQLLQRWPTNPRSHARVRRWLGARS